MCRSGCRTRRSTYDEDELVSEKKKDHWLGSECKLEAVLRPSADIKLGPLNVWDHRAYSLHREP